MGASTMLARADARAHRSSLLVLGALVVTVTAVVGALGAGARRTATVLERYRVATDASDYTAGAISASLAADADATADVARRLAAAPGVGSVSTMIALPAGVGAEYDFGLLTGPDRTFLDVDRRVLVSGRLPERGDEVALQERVATELGLGPGDSLPTTTMSSGTAVELLRGGPFELDGPVLQLRVVGVVSNLDELRPPGQSNASYAVAAPGFMARHPDVGALSVFFPLTVDDRRVDLDAVRSIVAAAAGSDVVFVDPTRSDQDALERSFTSLALGLALAAAVAAIAGAVAIGLGLARHMAGGLPMRAAARSLGASRAEIGSAASGAPVAVSVLAVVVGAGLSVLASPLFPISVARRAEPSPGLRFDPVVVPVLVVGTVAVVAAIAAAVAWRTTSPAGRRGSAVPTRRSVRIRRVLPPTATIGVGRVLDGRGASHGVPAGAAVGALALGVAGAVGGAGVIASQHLAATSPAHYGVVWDSTPDVSPQDRASLPVVEALAGDERIDAVGGLFCDERGVAIAPSGTVVCAMEVMGGSMALVVTRGRAPASTDEIALGRLTADSLHADLGDTVAVVDADATVRDLTIVGEMLLPAGIVDRPGSGAVVTGGGLERIIGGSVFDVSSRTLLLSYPDGVDADELETALSADYPLAFDASTTVEAPELVVQLGRLRPVLVGLVAFLAALALVGLVHYLVVWSRRGRTEIAVLRTLGLRRSQVVAAAAWQGATVAVLGVLVGIPAGLLAGRFTWRWLVGALGMIDAPQTPWLVLAGLPVVAIGTAVAISWLPGRRSVAGRPAAALRAE